MIPGTRLALGFSLAFGSLMPLTALAITPDTTGGSDPVVEVPSDPDPVVENPVKEGERRIQNGGLTREKETKKPSRKTPKQVVRVTPKKPGTMVYPVPSKANYCPNGLQPVTISGVISCGSPNKSVTYRQMLQHPQPVRVQRKVRKTTYHRSAVPSCTPGLKGCSDR